MDRRRIIVVSVFVVALVAACAGGYLFKAHRAAAAGSIAYVPISSSVFVNPAVVAQWAKTHNEAAVARHAVTLWNGLTAPTNESFNGVRLAVYDTWYTPCEIYGVSKDCGNGEIFEPTFLDLQPPTQDFHTPSVVGTDILSNVRYNQEMKDFVDTGYQGAPYTTGAGLVKAMKAGLTDLVDTAAPSAMMLKPTYDLFSSTQPTVIGFWKGPGLTVQLGASTTPLVPGPSTWLSVAMIDPTGKATNAKPVSFCAETFDPTGKRFIARTYVAPARTYRVIPLSQFYAIPVTSREIGAIELNRIAFERQQLQTIAERFGPRAAAAAAQGGCPHVIPQHPVAALVGMHVVSAELHNIWTWQTFWWNPTVRPLPGARRGFQYFDYATAYWTVDTKPYGWRYAFNPYLETQFGTATFGQTYWPPQGKPGSVINLGITTNCISCHAQATYALNKKVNLKTIYVAHDSEPQIALPNAIKTRNLWSLANNAGHPNQ